MPHNAIIVIIKNPAFAFFANLFLVNLYGEARSQTKALLHYFALLHCPLPLLVLLARLFSLSSYIEGHAHAHCVEMGCWDPAGLWVGILFFACCGDWWWDGWGGRRGMVWYGMELFVWRSMDHVSGLLSGEMLRYQRITSSFVTL